jgi:hypothetical protein
VDKTVVDKTVSQKKVDKTGSPRQIVLFKRIQIFENHSRTLKIND